MRRTELFQDTVVIVLINLPLIVDSGGHEGGVADIKKTLTFSDMFYEESWPVPHILISPTHCKVVCLRRVDVDGVQPHFFVTLLHHHQFTATIT